MPSVSRYSEILAHAATFVVALGCTGLLHAQSVSSLPKAGLSLPVGASERKTNAFLATLRPPTSIQTLESGNDLLLEFPTIATAGHIRFKAVSTIPRTDGMWLLSLSPQPESGDALFAAVTLEPSALPEATLLLNLEKTQPILLVVRAGGKYYGLQREIKIGVPMLTPTAK